jgi:ABC-type multidrug transport system fused ATPase/permease subunit
MRVLEGFYQELLFVSMTAVIENKDHLLMRPQPPHAILQDMPTTPRLSAISRLTFSWIMPLVRQATRERLATTDLVALPKRYGSARDAAILRAKVASLPPSALRLPRSIAHTYRRELLIILALSLGANICGLSAPLLLREVIKGLEGKRGFLSPLAEYIMGLFTVTGAFGYPLVCSLILFINSVLGIFLIHHLFWIQPIFGVRCRAALNDLIYEKAIRQERSAHQQISSGFIVNLVGTDTLRIATFSGFMHSAWHHPLQLIVAIYLLYYLLGMSALIGSSTLLLVLVISILVSREQTRIRRELSRISDRRVGLTHESLVHIKAAKFQGWEENLTEKISTLRISEVAFSKKLARLSAISSFASGSAPAVAMAVTCGVAISQGVSLDAATIFPVLTLFVLLRFALNNLPSTLFAIIESWVALQRIESFLETADHTPPRSSPEMKNAITMTNVVRGWTSQTPAVTIPSLAIERGELVVVIGSVGAGKSALLLSILGELQTIEGTIDTCGALGYCPQTAWIVSDSIIGNITLGLPLDLIRYRKALRASGLLHDLTLLPHGDKTQIGERGINLSGGQRQRVALARALYGGADIYLLDDPLSALDPKVANHVFRHMILGEMSENTRVLVSHRLEYALMADRVLVMKEGLIHEVGSPKELSRPGTEFSRLLKFHEKMSNTLAPSIKTISTEEPPISPTLQTDDEETIGMIITEEERGTGGVAWSAIRKYIERLVPGISLFFLISLFLGRQAASLSADIWVARSSQQSFNDLSSFLTGYVAIILALCSVVYLRSIYTLTRGLAAGVDSHRALLSGVLHAPMRFFESNPVGRIINRFSRDLETVELSLPSSLIDAGHCLLETITACIFIAIVAPATLVVIVPISIAYYMLQRMYRPISREAQRMYSVTLSGVFAHLSESLSSVESLRACRLVDAFTTRFCALLDANTTVSYNQTSANRWIGIRLELLGSFLILGVGVSASLGFGTAVGIGFSGLTLAYASSVTSVMNWAIRSVSMVESHLTSFERIERYAQTPSERLTGDIPDNWPSRGEIKISNLTVKYRPNLPPALFDLSCRIPAGTRVGIVGRTGSGKSTTILALMRILEAESGSIEIDGENIAMIKLAHLRSSLTVVPQEPVLFSGTLRENLDPFDAHDNATIIAALHRAELGEFLSSLPLGLSTRVREGGFNVSCGQRQLICLARALLRNSKVIILDEATAAIDVATDFAIQKTIRQEFQSATVIVIAHRLATVMDSDLILALDGGRLAECDSPKTLLSLPSSLLSQLVAEMQRSSRSISQHT